MRVCQQCCIYTPQLLSYANCCAVCSWCSHCLSPDTWVARGQAAAITCISPGELLQQQSHSPYEPCQAVLLGLQNHQVHASVQVLCDDFAASFVWAGNWSLVVCISMPSQYFDGGSRCNPGFAGYGAVVTEAATGHEVRLGAISAPLSAAGPVAAVPM
jgi:hypothetical protein